MAKDAVLTTLKTATAQAIKKNLKNYTMVFALLFIWILFGSLTDWIFFSPRNLSNLFRQMSIIGFLAIGMVLVIVTGNIDLSVGSVTGFISATVAFFQVSVFPRFLPAVFPNAEPSSLGILSTVLVIVIALGLGLLVGLWQGAIIAYAHVPAFIVTLGGMMIFRGGVLGVTRGKTITPIEDSLRGIAQGYIPKGLGLVLALIVSIIIFAAMLYNHKRKISFGFTVPALYKTILRATFFSSLVMAYVLTMNSYRGIQNPVLILAIVAVIITYISLNTRFGRYAYAIGGNKEATRLSGIDITKTVFMVYLSMGFLAGIAGLMLTGYVAAGTTNGGDAYELDTIAACVIGGTSLMGGEGTILGAVVGALIMASLINGMSVMNMDIFWQYVVKGLVLIVAVYIDVLSKQTKN